MPSSSGRPVAPLVRTVVTCVAALVLYGRAAVGPGADFRLTGAESGPRSRYAAIAFDYFVLFNPDSIVAAVDRVFPGKARNHRDLADTTVRVRLASVDRRPLRRLFEAHGGCARLRGQRRAG